MSTSPSAVGGSVSTSRAVGDPEPCSLFPVPCPIFWITTVSGEALRSETESAGYFSDIQKYLSLDGCSTPSSLRKSRNSLIREPSTLPKHSPLPKGNSNAAQRRWCSRITRLSGLISPCSGVRPKNHEG